MTTAFDRGPPPPGLVAVAAVGLLSKAPTPPGGTQPAGLATPPCDGAERAPGAEAANPAYRPEGELSHAQTEGRAWRAGLTAEQPRPFSSGNPAPRRIAESPQAPADISLPIVIN